MNLTEQRMHRAREAVALIGDNPTFDLILDLLDGGASIAATEHPEGGYLFHVTTTRGRTYGSRGRTIADAIESVWEKMASYPVGDRLT